MAERINDVQRDAILRLLAQGLDRKTIAYQVGVTPGQVSAVAAHVKMGTYALPGTLTDVPPPQANRQAAGSERSFAAEAQGASGIGARPVHLVDRLPAAQKQTAAKGRPSPVFLGTDGETEEEVYWNPDPQTGTANPHMLVLGESGFGKTYTISALLTELARQQTVSIVFDYGQGFSRDVAPPEFLELAAPKEIHASRDGVAINPLQIFPCDLHGPVNVAQRIADTFCRVYSKLGIQQHAVLREAVLEVFADAGIHPDVRETWTQPTPPFAAVDMKLAQFAEQHLTARGRTAATVGSHISTVFVFNTFRPGGESLSWASIFQSAGANTIQLKGLEDSLERAATELLLWNLIGFAEARGPGPLKCFVVLDEAHRLSFANGSPVEKLLREGRKFGVGLILASQQPQDFSTVAFANTATKLVFQVADENGVVSRQLHRKIRNSHSLVDIAKLITKLPRGWAYVVTSNTGRVVRIASFEERGKRPPDTSIDG